MPNQSGKTVLVLVPLLLILGAGAYFFLPSFKENNISPILNSQPSISENKDRSLELTKGYYSTNLKISLMIPKESEVEEKFINITISTRNGMIFITRNGTNYENAKEYYEDLKEKHNLEPREYKEGMIKSYDYVMTLGEDPNDKSQSKKTYLVYADYGIYVFSTSDESLYPVLEQIVQSFEYTP